MKKIHESLINDFRHGILLTLIALFVVFFFWSSLERLECGLYDVGLRLRLNPSSAPVCIIGIDEKSMDNFGPWPWPRSYIGFMIDLLEAYEAKVIGLDIIYSDKDLNRGLKEVLNIIQAIEDNPQYSKKNISTIVLLAALKDAEQRLDNDAILAHSIATSKKVVLPLSFNLDKPDDTAIFSIPDFIAKNSLFSLPSEKSIIAYKMTAPIELFTKKAFRLGHTNIIPDKDGIVRSETFFVNYNYRIFPSFALQLVLAYYDLDLHDLKFGKNLDVGIRSIPLVKKNKMLIAFKNYIPHYSFVDVINKRFPAETFKNKIIIIAPVTQSLGEFIETPTAYKTSSAKIIANTIDNILSNDYVFRPDWASALELIIIFLFGLYIALVIPRLKAIISGLISLFLIAMWIAVSLYLLVTYGYWIRAIYPAFVLLIGYVIIVSKRYEVTPKS